MEKDQTGKAGEGNKRGGSPARFSLGENALVAALVLLVLGAGIYMLLSDEGEPVKDDVVSPDDADATRQPPTPDAPKAPVQQEEPAKPDPAPPEDTDAVQQQTTPDAPKAPVQQEEPAKPDSAPPDDTDATRQQPTPDAPKAPAQQEEPAKPDVAPPDDTDAAQQQITPDAPKVPAQQEEPAKPDLAPPDDTDATRQQATPDTGIACPDDPKTSAQQGGEPSKTGMASSDGSGLMQRDEEDPETAHEMVSLPAGSFCMGDAQGIGDSDEAPAHTVHVESFSLGKYEVMEFQFEAFIAATGYDAGDDWRSESKGGDHPVVSVSWDDAQAYINWLNDRTGKRYRLPTEAEWEYAARAGSTTEYHFGDDAGRLRRYANYADRIAGPVSAGSHKPNRWGLHDMHGNVWEWVGDCWHGNYDGAPTDGSAWTSSHGGDCEKAVIRGGFWGSNARDLRVANRDWDTRSTRGFGYGFRLAHD